MSDPEIPSAESLTVELKSDRKPLPDRVVAITVDDAYISVYRAAWPRLHARGCRGGVGPEHVSSIAVTCTRVHSIASPARCQTSGRTKYERWEPDA